MMLYAAGVLYFLADIASNIYPTITVSHSAINSVRFIFEPLSREGLRVRM